jgi:hypothetical protein
MLIGEINKIGPSTIHQLDSDPLLPAVARFMQRSRMAVLSTLLYRAGADFVAAHSFFHTLSAANSTTEFAKILMVAATTVSSCAGVHTVGLFGQRSRMAGGMSGGSMSSMVSWSAPLMGPWASWVMSGWLDGDTVPPGASRSRLEPSTSWRDRFVLWASPLGYLARIWQ